MPYDDDADMVELLLHRNDGRMTLTELYPHFDCSQGTISTVTRKMERDGRVKRLQYRGQVTVYLPDLYDETWGISDEPRYRPIRPPNADIPSRDDNTSTDVTERTDDRRENQTTNDTDQ